jgi:16S rRNA processing protein RimM
VSQARVHVGYVVRAHGLRGAVRVRPSSERAPATAATLTTAGQVFLDDRPFVLRKARVDKEELIVELEQVDDRDQAEALRGRVLTVAREALPQLAEDELYVADLVGCEVVDTSGRALGRVRGSMHNGAHETLILDGPRGEVLLPFVAPLVREVVLEDRRVVYDPPPGLVDLGEADEG